MEITIDDDGKPIFARSWAQGFPELDDQNLVDRQSFIEAIERMLVESQIVFLEAEEGYGATTTAAQFCLHFPENSFGLFVKPSSRTTYSPDFIRLTLAEQVTWYLDQKEFKEDSIDQSTFGTLMYRLRRRVTKQKPVYFMIDGLQKITHVESILREIFHGILPTWIEHARFVICGKQSDFQKYTTDISSKYITALAFSTSDTQRFLLPFEVPADEVRTIHQMCKGIPGRLASVRRLILSGSSLQEILSSSPEKFPSFIKLEFAHIDDLSKDAAQFLALVAFSGRQLSEEELLNISSLPTSALEELYSACKFIAVSGDERTIDFVSDAHRRFASTALEREKTNALAAHIRYLSLSPVSSEALRYLPLYYQQLDQASEIVQLLNTGHFSELLKITSSLSTLSSRARIGMKYAAALGETNEGLGFSLMQSVFLAMAKTAGSSEEIRALVALGQHQNALAISFNRSTNEERLKFLAAYAKVSHELTDTVDPEILQAIQVAAKTIDFKQLGEVAIDLASDIVHVDPDLAMSIVEDVAHSNPGVNKDLAFVRLSLETSSKDSERDGARSNNSKAKISDEKLQIFVSTVTALLADYTFTDLINACNTIDASRQLSFLGYWIREHKDDADAISVAEYGLDLMIRDSTHKPKMREFRELAQALPNSTDKDKVKALVKRFDSQRGLIADSSITTDTVSLQLTLAHAESTFDIESASSRILDCYFDLSQAENSDTKLEGFPLMLKHLEEIDVHGLIENKHECKRVITTEFDDLLNYVLDNSADHFLITKFAIRQFSSFDIEKAIEIAGRLNAETRRDQAFIEVCRSTVREEQPGRSISNFLKAMPKISSIDHQWSLLESLLDNMSIRKLKLQESEIEGLEKIVLTVGDTYLAARSMISMIKLRSLSGLVLPADAVSFLTQTISRQDASYNRARLYFESCEAISKFSIDDGHSMFELAQSERGTSPVSSAPLVQILTYCILLCSRSIGGSIAAHNLDSEWLSRFAQMVDLLPGRVTRAELNCDLASRAYFGGRPDIAKATIGEFVIPLLNEGGNTDPFNEKSILLVSLPTMYLTHQVIALQKLRTLPRHDRENVAVATLDLLITKSPVTNPALNGAKDEFDLTFSEALETLALVELLEDDWNVYSALSRVCKSVASKRNSKNFTAQQKADLAEQLRAIVKLKLPDVRNIRHDGYLIICEASVQHLLGCLNWPTWAALINNANAIANIADRGFIIYEISAVIPGKFSSKRTELQNAALTLFNSVPSAVDKINRLIVLSEGVARDGLLIAKQSLRSAMTMTLQIVDEELARDARRRIVDIADKIGTEFADELAELIDTDSARKHAQMEVKQRMKMLAVKKKISDVKESLEMSQAEVRHLPEATWRNLLGLISGRLEIKSPVLMMKYVEASSQFDIQSALPILSWIIENNSRKYESARDSAGAIKYLTEKLMRISEFSANVMLAMTATSTEKSRISTGPQAGDVLMGLNNRNDTLEYIEGWLAECDDEILLCDPYFGAKENDLEFLRLVLRACPSSDVTILTGKNVLMEQNVNSEELFMNQWRGSCDQAPPSTRVIGVGALENKKLAIHDRWLICGTRGLKLGTSFNGIGTGKLSAISILDCNEIESTSSELKRFCQGERTIDGERISYCGFTI